MSTTVCASRLGIFLGGSAQNDDAEPGLFVGGVGAGGTVVACLWIRTSCLLLLWRRRPAAVRCFWGQVSLSTPGSRQAGASTSLAPGDCAGWRPAIQTAVSGLGCLGRGSTACARRRHLRGSPASTRRPRPGRWCPARRCQRSCIKSRVIKDAAVVTDGKESAEQLPPSARRRRTGELLSATTAAGRHRGPRSCRLVGQSFRDHRVVAVQNLAGARPVWDKGLIVEADATGRRPSAQTVQSSCGPETRGGGSSISRRRPA